MICAYGYVAIMEYQRHVWEKKKAKRVDTKEKKTEKTDYDKTVSFSNKRKALIVWIKFLKVKLNFSP